MILLNNMYCRRVLCDVDNCREKNTLWILQEAVRRPWNNKANCHFSFDTKFMTSFFFLRNIYIYIYIYFPYIWKIICLFVFFKMISLWNKEKVQKTFCWTKHRSEQPWETTRSVFFARSPPDTKYLLQEMTTIIWGENRGFVCPQLNQSNSMSQSADSSQAITGKRFPSQSQVMGLLRHNRSYSNTEHK